MATDAEYLRWHTLDHRPEQHRLSGRARIVAVGVDAGLPVRTCGEHCPLRRDRPRDDVLLHRPGGLEGFNELSQALGDAGRKLPLLPPVERGVYEVQRKAASPRVKVGADVLPWWPMRGRVPVVLENARRHRRQTGRRRRRRRCLVRIVAGRRRQLASAPAGQTITYCFLDDDPVATAERLRPVLETRWSDRGSNRYSPHRFTRSCPTSGIAMCRRKGIACASA